MKYDNLYEEMVFSLDKYKWQKTDEEARKFMWDDIKAFLKILTMNEYVAKIYDDESDIIVVQYEHDEHAEYWGCAQPYWLSSDEIDAIECAREDISNDTK